MAATYSSRKTFTLYVNLLSWLYRACPTDVSIARMKIPYLLCSAATRSPSSCAASSSPSCSASCCSPSMAGNADNAVNPLLLRLLDSSVAIAQGVSGKAVASSHGTMWQVNTFFLNEALSNRPNVRAMNSSYGLHICTMFMAQQIGGTDDRLFRWGKQPNSM